MKSLNSFLPALLLFNFPVSLGHLLSTCRVDVPRSDEPLFCDSELLLGHARLFQKIASFPFFIHSLQFIAHPVFGLKLEVRSASFVIWVFRGLVPIPYIKVERFLTTCVRSRSKTI